jgi:hypothetical protein
MGEAGKGCVATGTPHIFKALLSFGSWTYLPHGEVTSH